MLFRHKPNVFSSFTISLGPLYVERLFDSLLTKSGLQGVVRLCASDRYDRYLALLKRISQESKREQYVYLQFYLGYFYQQLAGEVSKDSRMHFQEKALCYYQNYLDLPAAIDEARFYAQWQCGMLQDRLDYPWGIAEASLLAATEIDPSRGEGIRQIVRHCVRMREWESAYRYSTIAVGKYFDRNPIAQRRWFVDLNAYNWNVLNTHLGICYKLRYFTEAETIYDRMLSYELTHLNEFTNMDIRHIHSLEKIFHQPKRAVVSA